MKKFGKFLLKALCVYAIWDVLVLAWMGLTRILESQLMLDKEGSLIGPMSIANDAVDNSWQSCKDWYEHFYK